MRKALLILALCSFLQTAYAKYEDLYNMDQPIVERTSSAVITQYRDKSLNNYLYTLDSADGEAVIEESFQEAIKHYKNNGAKVISHNTISGGEIITFGINGCTIHLIKQYRRFTLCRLTQVLVNPKSENYENFKNYLKANNLIQYPADILVETHELNASMMEMEAMFNEYF